MSGKNSGDVVSRAIDGYLLKRSRSILPDVEDDLVDSRCLGCSDMCLACDVLKEEVSRRAYFDSLDLT